MEVVTSQSPGICTKKSMFVHLLLGYNKCNTNKCAELFQQIGENIVVHQ